MGISANRGIATTVAADPDLFWKVPDDWTFEDAATVPVAYATAYYGLIIRANLRKGEKVLIHSGSGGVGQAAIAIALSMNCEVYTSVGSTAKREFLTYKFPSLKGDSFCNSRNLSFEKHILTVTGGKGVDVILNSLAEDKLKASLNCLAKHGRFIEIGKYDLVKNTNLGMSIFLKNIQYHGLMLDTLIDGTIDPSSTFDKKQLYKLIDEGIKSKVIKPLNAIMFHIDEVETPFRIMASGQHVGKVLIKLRQEESEKIVVPKPIKVSTFSKTYFHPKKSYVIIGGLGNFGLELCDWMIKRGAVNIMLTSRSKIRNGYQKYCLLTWKNTANVVISNLNAVKENEAIQILNEASKLGPVGGIFHSVMVLKDAFITNQTVQGFKGVVESKATSADNLDRASRKLCPELDHFVCFSSISCGCGNPGQTNYGFANSVMERICEDRKNHGLPGLAVQYGFLGDVRPTAEDEVIFMGTLSQSIPSCLKALDQFLQQDSPIACSFVLHKVGITDSETIKKRSILSAIANVFGLSDSNAMSLEASLAELGMDSLMSVEIQQILEQEYGLIFSIQEIRQLKVKELKKLGEAIKLDNKTEKISDEERQERIKQINNFMKKNVFPMKAVVPLNDVKEGTPLFIVHPLDGQAVSLEGLAKLFTFPTYGLQLTDDAPSDTIENLASFYLKHIKEIVGDDKPLYVSGFSFGTIVAYEICLQAEVAGDIPPIKSLIFIDSAPTFMRRVPEESVHLFMEADFEPEIQFLCVCLFSLKYLDINELINTIKRMETVEEKKLYLVREIRKENPHVQEKELEYGSKLYGDMFIMVSKYIPRKKLDKDVIVLGASDTLERTKTFAKDQSLDEYCTGTVTTYIIEADHFSIIRDESAKEIAKILNDILD